MHYLSIVLVLLWPLKVASNHTTFDHRNDSSRNQTIDHRQILFKTSESDASVTYKPVDELSAFPWAVSLQRLKYRMHICTANILTNLHVLTTCHCVSTTTGSKMTPFYVAHPKDFIILAGVTKLGILDKGQRDVGQVRSIVQINIHPDCTPKYDKDFAVMELAYYLYYTPTVQPMPRSTLALPGMECSIVEWHFRANWYKPIVNEVEGLSSTKYIILGPGNCTLEDMPTWNINREFLCCQAVGDDFFTGQSSFGGSLSCANGVSAIFSRYASNRRYAIFSRLESAWSFLHPFYSEWERIPDINTLYHNRVIQRRDFFD